METRAKLFTSEAGRLDTWINDWIVREEPYSIQSIQYSAVLTIDQSYSDRALIIYIPKRAERTIW
jgi:hypothetical protein